MSELPGGISISQFRFLSCSYNQVSGEAVLGYSFDDGEEFFERIRFPYKPWPSEPSRQVAFDKALTLLHLVAGVSYYKACVPEQMDTGDHQIDHVMADFLNQLYIKGLAEFAYTNELELESKVNFAVKSPGKNGAGFEPTELDLPERSLVAMGGGKDSLVSLEMLRGAGLEIQPICVGQSELIAQTVRAAGLPLIQIERELSPALIKMNEAGALNGHVPVTAINSAILLCASILYGYRWIVFSNESSADEATLVDADGIHINHQYSKSLEFEIEFQNVICRQISPGIGYFSLLRPLNELSIAQRFSRLDRYHAAFSSCNRNFHLDGPRISDRWCGDCPKCRFTSLALAPFLSADELISIMGQNLLDVPAQEQGFRALCRLGVEKPFECVGSVDESRAAMLHLSTLDSWKGNSIVQVLAQDLAALNVPDFETMLKVKSDHRIPPGVFQDVAL